MLKNGETYTERLLIDTMPKMGENFNNDKIIETLREIQRGEIDYSTFIRRIVSFGTVSYTVYIDESMSFTWVARVKPILSIFHFKRTTFFQ